MDAKELNEKLNKKREYMKPCDCTDIETAQRLETQGVSINNNSILVEPNIVILEIGHTTVRIPMGHFAIFAKWYLESQPIKDSLWKLGEKSESLTK